MIAGSDFLECDLQLTADEVLVCVHGTTMDRTSDGTGRVDDHTLAELQALDLGSWFNEANPDRARPELVGADIVQFEEQLDHYLAMRPAMRFHIETKAPAEYAGRTEPLLVDVLRERGLLDTGGPLDARIVVQSFELDSLVRNSQISRIESGRHRTNLDTLTRIAHALGLRLVVGFETASATGDPKRQLVAF